MFRLETSLAFMIICMKRILSRIINRYFSTKSEIKPSYIKPWTTVLIDGVIYGRNFGKWKCLNCNRSWLSAYTWISTNFCFANEIVFKDTKGRLLFSGKKLKDKDFLIEKCQNCDDVNNTNVRIMSYNNLEGSNHMDNHIAHNADLCVKCIKGYPCQSKKYFSTVSSRINTNIGSRSFSSFTNLSKERLTNGIIQSQVSDMDQVLKVTNFNHDLLTILSNEVGLRMDVLKEYLLEKIIKLANKDKNFVIKNVKDITLRKDSLVYKDNLLTFDVFVCDLNYLVDKKVTNISLPVHLKIVNPNNELDTISLFNKIEEYFNDIKGINARGFVFQEKLRESIITKDFIPLFRTDFLKIESYPIITSKIMNIITLNLLILIEEKVGNILNDKEKRISDEQSNYKIVYNKLLGMLDPFIRIKIQKRGIVTIQNTYAGFDTEYEPINAIMNKLLSVQLAVSTKTMVKIPKNAFDISNKNEDTLLESAIIQDLNGFNNDLFQNVINNGIKRYRNKYKIYDRSINQLKEGLLELQEHNKLKHISDNSYDIFVFPRTEIRTAIFLNKMEEGFTLANLINEIKILVKTDINKTYEDLMKVLKEIYNKVSMDNFNEIELLGLKWNENYYDKEIYNEIDTLASEDDTKRLSRSKMNSFTGDMANVTKIKNIYLIAHLTNADLTMLKDFETFKEQLDIVNSSFVTLGKPILVGNNRIFIRDTMLLSPAGNQSLDSIGKLYNIKKIDIGTFDKSKMSELLEQNQKLFIEYAIRDAVITLVHACFMEDFNLGLNKLGIPLTLSSLGTTYVKYKWDLMNYKGYQINPNIKIGDTSRLMTPRGLINTIDVALYLPLFIAAYKGGRNECFMYGTDNTTDWFDYDLTSAYTTAMASLGDPEYSKAKRLSKSELLKLDDKDIINSYTVIKAEFEFPAKTKYPSIPVFLDDTTTVYPLTGNCVITGIEYVLAKNQGCKFKFQEIFKVPFGKIKPFEDILKEIQSKRRQYPKGDINNLLYKEMGNSIYGNSVRGISDKRKFDIKSGTLLRMEPSELSNPLIGSWITAFIRSVLGECLHNIHKMNGKIISCTTDGFVTDLKNLEELFNNCGGSCGAKNTLMKNFQGIRNLLAGNSSGLEIKHEGKGIISWSTRGQFSLNSGIAATTGFQRKQFDPYLIETWFKHTLSKSDKSLEFIQQRLRSALDIYKNGGHVTKTYTDRLFRLQFDNRREIIIPEGLENNIDFSNIMFDSNPASDITKVKYLRGMSKINLNSIFDKRLGKTTVSNKYRDYTDLAIRNFIKGILNGYYKEYIKFQDYESLIKFIKGYKPSFRISKSSISNLKHRPIILKSVPLTEDVIKFRDYVRKTYPHFNID